MRGLIRAPPLRDRPGLTRKFSLSSLAMERRLTSKRARTRAASIDRIKIAPTRRVANKRRTPHQRTLREPSLEELKSKRKFLRTAARHLPRCRPDGVARCKNQCADNPLRPEGASERQFALSCPPRPPRPPRSLVPSGHLPSLNFPRTRSHARENTNAVIAVDPCIMD